MRMRPLLRRAPPLLLLLLLLASAAAPAAGRFPGDDQRVEGAVFTLLVPTPQATSLLPPGLELAPLPTQWPTRRGGSGDGRSGGAAGPGADAGADADAGAGDANGTHPILLSFVTQYDVGSPFTKFTYREFILTVPYVQWDDAHAPVYPNYRGPFAYLPHLFLNESEPVDLGHSYVGDRKEFAAIALEEDDAAGTGSFVVTGVNASHWDPAGGGLGPDAHTGAFPGKVIVSAMWNASGLDPAFRNASEWPGLSLAGYNLPNVARWPNNGTWTCLPQNYYLDDALVAPAAGRVDVLEPFQAGLAVGSWEFPALSSPSSSSSSSSAAAAAEGVVAEGRAALAGARVGVGVLGGYRLRTSWDYTNLPLHPARKGCDDFNKLDP